MKDYLLKIDKNYNVLFNFNKPVGKKLLEAVLKVRKIIKDDVSKD